ncbi:vitamin D 25-hydroxylase-like [Styela clava]
MMRKIVKILLITQLQKSTREPCLILRSNVELVATVIDLVAAATEATASVIRWCILAILHYPYCQEKIAKELHDVVGTEEKVAMKHQEKMPYTRAFIQEIFRYRPTLPLAIAHETTSEIRIGNFKIPKNTMITPNIWAAHRDPKPFENPNKFRPERFIDENGGFIPCDDVIPFSIGNRHCIGEHIARMEVFLFFTTLLRRFKISASKDKPLPSFDEGVFSIGYSPKKFDIVCHKESL